MKNVLVVIPAIKKNAVIPDQLIKKLNGKTLIQRAIDIAINFTDKKNILIVTDSEEISLICERNSLKFYKDKDLKLSSDNILDIISNLVKDFSQENIFLYRANTPLVESDTLHSAYKEFLKNTDYTLVSVKAQNKKLFEIKHEKLVDMNGKTYYKELKSFHIFSKSKVKNKNFKPFLIEQDKSIEIQGYQDWWICEKVLQRKRIVFNVIGSTKIGMGHIYHSLALAHEITSHEVIFVCDEKYEIAVEQIASSDYKVISAKDVLKTIVKLKPDLVINDVLNTDVDYIKSLKKEDIKVVNFEDLGDGSRCADLVFNELYDTPQLKGKQYLWGYEYLALRDEFYDAIPHKSTEKVKEVLIAFGGTDQNNLTLKTLKAIFKICKKKNIKIHIVCGSPYLFKKELEEFLLKCKYKNIELTYASNAISKVMEKTQLAITSNGRTVYELADMNIPSIVISHHEREYSHAFANLERGFINLGIIHRGIKSKTAKRFEKLVNDKDYRELLFMNMEKYSFRKNKQKVVNKIMELIK